MTKPKKIGIVLLTAGAVLVIAALLLFSRNRAEDRRAGESAEETLRLVEAAMAERGTNGETGTTPARRRRTRRRGDGGKRARRFGVPRHGSGRNGDRLGRPARASGARYADGALRRL